MSRASVFFASGARRQRPVIVDHRRFLLAASGWYTALGGWIGNLGGVKLDAKWETGQAGRVHVHVLPTRKYKTTSILLQLEGPLTRDRVTAQALVPHILAEATRRYRSPALLTQAFESLYGASLSARPGKHGDMQTAEFTVHVPADTYIPGRPNLFAQSLRLLAEVVLDPATDDGEAFDAGVTETEKGLHRARIEHILNDKLAYATERCLAEQCGTEPCGLPRLGFVEDIAALAPSALYTVWRDMVANMAMHLYVVGPHDHTAVLQGAQEVFVVRGEPAPELRIEPALPGHAHVREVVEEMDVGQGKLHIGLRSGLGFASDLYPALLVYNGILGGFAHSKLFLNVRENANLAYYASSRLDALKGLLMISSGIDIANFDRAREIIARQLADMRAGEISEQELQFTQDALITRYLQSDDQPLAGATLHMYSRLTGRERTPRDLIEGIRKVRKDDVVAVAHDVVEEIVYFLRDKEGIA